MNYQLYVRTRSWQGDYRWVGSQPAQWWKGRPEAGLVINSTGLWLNNSSDGSRFIITGIVGNRQDFTGTPIRYELAISPDVRGNLTDDDVKALVASYLDSDGIRRLGVGFDDALGAAANSEIDGNSPAVVTGIVTFIKSLPRMSNYRRITEMLPESDKVITLPDGDTLYSELVTPEIRSQFNVEPVTTALVAAKSVRTPKSAAGGGGCLVALCLPLVVPGLAILRASRF